MDELSPRARALLDAANGVDDPLPGDSARIRQRVTLRIGSAGFGAALFTMSVERAKALLGAAVPKFVAIVLIAVGSSAVYQKWQVHHLPSSLVASVPTQLPEAVPSNPVADPQPEPAPASAPSSVAPRAVGSLKASAHSTSSGLEAEMRYVRAADAALRSGDVGLAQSLLNQHAREFPNGALAEEREGLRVVAGCQSGASAGVQRAASRFLQRAPRSLMAGRVRAACPALPENGG